MKNKTRKISAWVLWMLMLITSIVSVSAETSIDSVTNWVTVDVQHSLTMTIESETLDLTVDPAINSWRNTWSSAITVSTNAKNGYRIQVRLQDNYWNDWEGVAQLKSASTSTPITWVTWWSDNYFNYATMPDLSDKRSFTNSLDFIDNANWSTRSDSVMWLDTVTNSETHNIYYEVNVDYLTEAANDYTGTVTYRAIPSF